MSDNLASAALNLLSPRNWRAARSALTGRPLPAPRPRGAQEAGLRTMILTSIRDIDAARWNGVVDGLAVGRSHAYLAAVEAAGIVGCRFFYPVIFNARNEIVGHACVYIIDTDLAQLLPRPAQTVVNRLRRVWPRFLWARLTECAAPLMVGHSISVTNPALRAAVIRRIADAASDIAHSQRSPIVLLRDFLPDAAPDLAVLREHGFNQVSNMPLARIHVRWPTYEAYLAAMRPRYRKDVERRLRRARAAGMHVASLREFGAQAEHWLRQAQVVYAAARRFKREGVTAGYYREMEHGLGEDCRLLAVMREGRAVAHGMVLTDATDTIATFFGRDAGPPGQEWFLLVDEVIRLAIARGSRHVHLGLGSYHAKALVGADFEPLAICCRSPHALVNVLMRLVPDIVNRRAFVTPCRIFRS